jgi:tripartite-type tricarboxylate transporter receptor subunit TctC
MAFFYFRRLRYFLAGLYSLLAIGYISPVAAQNTWPNRPIHLVVTFPPGSSPDLLARTLSQPLSAALGQTIVIENKPGAGGTLGTRMVTQAKPDGYTLLYTINGPLVTAPTLYKKTLGYDPLKDLVPITLVATSPNVLVVPSNLGVDSVADFVKLAAKRPGVLNYGSVGPGSASHLSMEMFKDAAHLDITHIPYASFPQIITAMLGGDIQAAFMVPSIAMPQVNRGAIKVLAVTSLTENAALPGFATMASQNYANFESISWNALLAPAGTPEPIIERFNRELARIINSDAVRQELAAQYFTPSPSTPEALSLRIRDEKTRWDKVIERLNLSLE